MLKNKRGITLIALVITIIIMLILAGVSINLVLNENNGLIKRTQVAVNAYEDGRINEEGMLQTISNTFDDYLAKIGQGESSTPAAPSGPTVTLGQKAPTGGATFTDTATKTAPIPEGWTVSGIASEATIDGGLVIYDLRDTSGNTVDTSTWDETYWITNATTIQETYNQFVWVPVPDSSKFTRNDWEYWDETNEPTQFTTTTLTSDEYSESQTVDPTGLYNTMVSSVTSKKGFYIGRYEAGTTEESGSGIRGTVVSKKNATVYNSIGWSNVNNMTTTTGGAVEVSRGMNVPSGTPILCYGVQWDAVMRWLSMDTSLKNGAGSNAAGTKSVVVDSTGHGNYKDTKETYGEPGNTGIFEMKNIYDMAGNVYEWTMEAYDTCERAVRGAYYDLTGSFTPVSLRGSWSPEKANGKTGFRVVLYL